MKDDPAALIRLGRLTARLIHDFKNRMGGLKLYAAYLKKRFADNAEAGEIVDQIVASLDAMAEQASLVARLARPLELRCAAGDLAGLVGAVVAGLQAQAAGRGIVLECDLATSLPPVSFDPLQLRAALNAVGGRACDVTPSGGGVQMTLRGDASGCVLELTDGGPRLTEPQCAALFELAEHEKLSRRTLELTLAQRIVAEHGGTLTAWVGATGTVVRVSLPSLGNGA